MVNLKIGAVLLIAAAALFLLSDTMFGDSEVASYAMLLGLIMFPVGLVLGFVGLIQLLIGIMKGRPK